MIGYSAIETKLECTGMSSMTHCGGDLGDCALSTTMTRLRWTRLLPPRQFDPNRPGTFVLVHLQRLLVQEAKSYTFAPHDGLDFCHAVIAAAYGSVIALDKAWKRRVERLPQATQLARTYYRPELDALVGLLESRTFS